MRNPAGGGRQGTAGPEEAGRRSLYWMHFLSAVLASGPVDAVRRGGENLAAIGGDAD